MAQYSDQEQDRAATVQPGVTGIQVGWTVYDCRERPIGNVSDLRGGRLHVDGRPEGHGYFDVPSDAVGRAEDGSVYLSLEMDQVVGRPEGAASPAATVPAEVGEAAGQAEYRGAETPGASYTASGTPVGLGSNTPVGGEPGGYRDWDARVEASPWSRPAFWLAPVGIGAASAGAYLWWRNRQARRSRLQRVTRAFAAAGDSVGSVAGAARERRQAWWLAPLVALPLALYLRSASDDEGALEAAGAGLRPAGRWKERLPSVTLPAREAIEPPAWTMAVPILIAAGLAAWFAGRPRRQPPDGTKPDATQRLRDVMTREVQVVDPNASLFEAATLMKRLDVGALPVCESGRLQGMLTDRDIVVRTVAESRDPQLATARDAMSPDVVYAFEADSVQRAAELMRQHRIRRLPVVDHDKNLVGIVSLADLAVDTGDERLSGATLERVSEPARPRSS